MKANELMIGDWVYNTHNKQNEQVEEVGSNCVMLAYNDLYAFDEIEPIPLTPEILEKNGFTGGKYKDYCGFVFYLSADGFREIGLTMSYKDNILWCEKIKTNYPNSFGDKYSIHHLDYVHQLQHAMRLCGIEKEIVL